MPIVHETMVEISKEDVLDWYQGLNASNRVEIICALLDHSLPFELRFLGSVIENLARKDFHVLREAEKKANSLHMSQIQSSSNAVPDQAAILRLLNDGPTPTSLSLNNPVTYSGAGNSHSANLPPSAGETPAGNAVAGRQQSGSQLQDNNKPNSAQQVVENGLSSSKSEQSLKKGNNDDGNQESNHKPQHPDASRSSSSSEVADSSKTEIIKKDRWLYDGIERRKLILYLSLLSATNHDSANLHYILMSDIGDLLENTEWLEDLEEKVQDEVLLLYTIGCHHPAFNFEQRTFLSTVLNRLKECLVRYSKDFIHPDLHPLCHNFNQILTPHFLPPQVSYYKRNTNIVVVSANPAKNSNQQHQQNDRSGKIYHHSNSSSGYNNNGPIERSSSTTTTNSNSGSMMNPPPYPNSQLAGIAVHNTQMKYDDPGNNEGVLEYSIPAGSQLSAYHTGAIYAHPSQARSVRTTYIPMQNGFLPPSYYANHVAGVAMSNSSGHPSSEMLMNQAHVQQQQYPFTFPFSIPPQNYGNPNQQIVNNNKTLCANIPPPGSNKDLKNQQLSMGGGGSGSGSPSGDKNLPNNTNTEQIGNVNYGSGGGRPPVITPTSHIVYSAGMVPLLSQSPMSNPLPMGGGGGPVSGSSGPAAVGGKIHPSNNDQSVNYGRPSVPAQTSHNTMVYTAGLTPLPTHSPNNQPMGGSGPSLSSTSSAGDNKIYPTTNNANDQQNLVLNYGRPPTILPAHTAASHNKLVYTTGGLILPAQSPMSSRQRGFNPGENALPSPGNNDFSSLDNLLMPPLDDAIEVTHRPRKVSCYNCGSSAHFGPECKDLSIEEMTKVQYRLNYGGSTDGKEGE